MDEKGNKKTALCSEEENRESISEDEAEKAPQAKSAKTGKTVFLKNHKKILIFSAIIAVIVVAVGIAAIVDGVNGIRVLGNFITDQLLGMKWLNALFGMLFTAIFGENFMATRWGGAIQFFFYDTLKIFILLCLLIFIISFIQSYFPPERTKKILGKYRGIGANAMGALLGTVTPFCSCSSIPIFMGFTRAGLSSGVTFSFLISSPLVDLGAFILLASVFGFPIAFTYVAVGLLLAIVGGTIIEKTGLGENVREFILQGNIAEADIAELTLKSRLFYAKDQMLSTLRKVWI